MSGTNRAVAALNDVMVRITADMTDQFSGGLFHLYRGRVSARVRSGLRVVDDVDTRRTPNQRDARDWYANPAMAELGLNARTGPRVDFDWFSPPPTARINREIDDCLRRVNPRWVQGDPRWRHNCVSVGTAYELRRRGYNVEAGQVPEELALGFYGTNTNLAWGRNILQTDLTGLFHAFRQPGARGIVIVEFYDGSQHQFNAEHVPAAGLRFVDGQPNPPLTDASPLLKRAKTMGYLRLDDVADIPPQSILDDLDIRFLDS